MLTARLPSSERIGSRKQASIIRLNHAGRGPQILASQRELFREHRVQPERNIALRRRSLAFGAISRRSCGAGRAVVLTCLAMLGSRHGRRLCAPRIVLLVIM